MPYDPRAQAKYNSDKSKVTFVGLKFNNRTDKDIIDYLSALARQGLSRQGTIKKAIRTLIECDKSQNKT